MDYKVSNKFSVGDRVYSKGFGAGTIDSIDLTEEPAYVIVVKWDEHFGETSVTIDGKLRVGDKKPLIRHLTPLEKVL